MLAFKKSDYRPQTKLREGNVFTPVCQSFRPQGSWGVYPSMDLPTPDREDTHPPPAEPPPGQTPTSPEIATKANSTHPTGMHTYLETVNSFCLFADNC